MINRRFKAVVLDLDDTLFDTWKQCYPAAAKESCRAMVKAGLKCSTDDCVKERIAFYKLRPKRDVFQHMVQHFGISSGGETAEEVANLGRSAFHARNVESNIKLFPRAKETLAELHANYMLFLVTSGDPDTQKQKVELLKIKEFFTHIYYVNVLAKQNKTSAFMDLLERTSLTPKGVLCVGNRRDREIAEGKRLGFVTCLVRRDHEMRILADRPEENPDYEIESIGELISACQL